MTSFTQFHLSMYNSSQSRLFTSSNQPTHFIQNNPLLGLFQSQFCDMALIAPNARPAAVRACKTTGFFFHLFSVLILQQRIENATPSNSQLQNVAVRICRKRVMFRLDQNLFKPIKILEVRSFRLPGGRPRPRLRKTSSMGSFSSLPEASLIPGLDRNRTNPVQNLLSNPCRNLSMQEKAVHLL